MKTLILVAHGSRREASNDEIRQLAVRVAEQAGDEFDEVTAAFLELAEPSIPDGIVGAIDGGAKEVLVLPYFLSAGRHVATDIPSEVEVARKARPDAKILIAPYAGSAEAMIDLLLGITAEENI